MIGLVFALFSGISFATSNIYVRQGVHRSGEAYSIIPIFALLGTVGFGAMVIIMGELGYLGSLSWLGVSALSVAGVIHFILGRICAYTGIRLIGANRTVPIFSSSILIAALLGIFLMGEPLTVSIIVAVLIILSGIILIGRTGNSTSDKLAMPQGHLVKGILAALGAALCWGVSPVLVKIGLKEVASPWVATFISYAASLVVISTTLFYGKNTEKLRRLNRFSLLPIIYAAVAVAIAQIFRYNALNYSFISAVEPTIMSTNSLLVFPLSFLINRQIEAFNLKIILGSVAIVAGVSLIFLVN